MAPKQNSPNEVTSTSPPSENRVATNVVSEIVVYKQIKKKKRGSSRSSRRLADLENRATKSFRRVSKAVDRGIKSYRERRDRSERKRRDGALVDLYENAAVGMSETIANASPVLSDFARAFNTRRQRKNIRKLIRRFPVPR